MNKIKKKTVYQIANELSVEVGTIRIWLSNFRFNKYRQSGKPLSFNITKAMLDDLEDYLIKKNSKRIKEVLCHLKWLKFLMG
jgi:hypothetical protein